MYKLMTTVAMVLLVATGCAATGKTAADKRASINEMRGEVLSELYALKQSARAEINEAPGYGVFSNANINVIFAGVGGGHGVIHNNQTGDDTYMRMGEVGVGLGAGVKDYRIVFVFHDAETMNYFVDKGWAFGGQADAAAKASDKGGAVGGEAILDGVTVYQLTQSGLALQATLKGTKYWKDDSLN
jgi:lipid-binding SYLF domain-containing protein